MERRCAEGLLDDWLENNYECDLVVHVSKKTPGCVVVETKDLMWCNRILRWFRYKSVCIKSNINSNGEKKL